MTRQKDLMRTTIALILAASAAGPVLAQAEATDFSADRILQDINVLSSDDYEGRAPATLGEEKTVAFLTGSFTGIGLQPGNPDGTYVQKVPMVGITSTTTTRFTTPQGTLTPGWINDYIAVSHHVVPHVDVKDSDLVFVGYGVVAPEYGWDDFKGVDVKGKTVVVLINDPQVVDPKDPHRLDPAMFKGKEMTYYGRWTYKYEEAAAKGAAGCLIIHETGPAGYPFAVVTVSQARENFDIRSPDGNASQVAVEGWLTLDMAKKLFASCGQDFDALKARAATRDFHPVDLGAKATFSIDNQIRNVDSRNVVGLLPGSDPTLAGEYIVYSCHWDHLGRDTRLKGDQIFNGAVDDASGVAQMLEIARNFARLPAGQRPKRSILFIGFTAEEKGLLGAHYYATNPLYPVTKTLADINMDMAQVAGRSKDLEELGYGNDTLEDIASRLLSEKGRVLVADTEPEKGYFYRADHFELSKVGIPSFYCHGGVEIVGKPEGYGIMRRKEFIADDYHKVSDDIKPWWDLRGAAEDASLYFDVGYEVANTDTWPTWKPGCEFKARREQDLAAK